MQSGSGKSMDKLEDVCLFGFWEKSNKLQYFFMRFGPILADL